MWEAGELHFIISLQNNNYFYQTVIIYLNKYKLRFYQNGLGKIVVSVHCCLFEAVSNKLTLVHGHCMVISCKISVLGIFYLPMTTRKSTISEPYEQQNSKSFFDLPDSTIVKVSFLGVISFGWSFRPALRFGQRYHVDRHGQLARKQ